MTDPKFTASPTCYVVLARLRSAFMVICVSILQWSVMVI